MVAHNNMFLDVDTSYTLLIYTQVFHPYSNLRLLQSTTTTIVSFQYRYYTCTLVVPHLYCFCSLVSSFLQAKLSERELSKQHSKRGLPIWSCLQLMRLASGLNLGARIFSSNHQHCPPGQQLDHPLYGTVILAGAVTLEGQDKQTLYHSARCNDTQSCQIYERHMPCNQHLQKQDGCVRPSGPSVTPRRPPSTLVLCNWYLPLA